MLFEFFYPFITFPFSLFTGLQGEDEIHRLQMPGAAGAGEGDGEYRLIGDIISCRYRLYDEKRDYQWVGPGVPAVNKDEAPGGEYHIVRDTVITHPVRCQDDGFALVHVRSAHATTHSCLLWVVRDNMLFSWTFSHVLVL
jgi:hypothetical protein